MGKPFSENGAKDLQSDQIPFANFGELLTFSMIFLLWPCAVKGTNVLQKQYDTYYIQ